MTFLCGGLLLLALTPASAGAEAAAAPLDGQVDPVADAVDRARALLEHGQIEEARKLAAELVAANIGTVREGMLRNLQGDIEERAGNLIAAAEAFQRAAHLDASEEHLFDWGNNLLNMRARTTRFWCSRRPSSVTLLPRASTLASGSPVTRAANTPRRSSRSAALPIWNQAMRGRSSSSARCTA